MTVRTDSAAKVRSAMESLLSEWENGTGPKLTIEALRLRAGVSRSTVQRTPGAVREFQARAHQLKTAQSAERANRDQVTIDEVRQEAKAIREESENEILLLAQQIQILSLENQHFRERLIELGDNVVPIRGGAEAK